MKLRPCTLGDILLVVCDLRRDEWEQVSKLEAAHDIDSLVTRCQTLPGKRWAFVSDDEPDRALVVGGFVPHRAGVVSSWFLASAYAWKHFGAEITEMTAERVRTELASGTHRIETVCLASRIAARKWYETTGLRLESTLKAYCADGSDAVMYVATRDV